MVQKNFILTDIMKTGNHLEWEQFIRFCDLHDQSFHMTGMWYHLHDYDLKSYDRRIAFVDARLAHSHLQNTFYKRDLAERIAFLESNDFKIIHVNPWECRAVHPSAEIIWAGEGSYFWYKMYQRYKDQEFKFDHNNKSFDFLYLNKTKRKHRDLLFDSMQNNGLLDRSLYSYHDRHIGLDKDYELPMFKDKDYPDYGHDRDIHEKPFNVSTVNIVSETITHDEVFLTEKIWKPIIAGQVFIVHGKANYLQDLTQHGFQTYGNYLDEGYDSIQSLESRTMAIVELCRKVKHSDHDKLYQDTRSVREHNQKVFFSKAKCQDACRKTIKGLLELVDRC